MEITSNELEQIVAAAVAAGIREYKRQEKADRQIRRHV